jgi:hypothetical protein
MPLSGIFQQALVHLYPGVAMHPLGGLDGLGESCEDLGVIILLFHLSRFHPSPRIWDD